MKPFSKNPFLASALLLVGSASYALADTGWQGNTSIDWTVASNWDNGLPGIGTGNTFVDSTPANIATISTNAGTVDGNLWIGENGGPNNGTLNMTSGGSLTAQSFITVGFGTGTGTVNLSGGALTANADVNIGSNGGTGTINLSGGTLTKTAVGGNFTISSGGDNSTGTVNLSAGAFNVATGINMGGGTNNTATLNISGTGALTVTGTTNLFSAAAGATGANLIHVTGGSTVSNGDFNIGTGQASAGQTNTYTQDGGSVTANSWLRVGQNGAAGVLNLNGGMFTKGSGGLFITASEGGGENATAQINQTGGTFNNTATGTLLSAFQNNSSGTTVWNASGGIGNFVNFVIGQQGTATLNVSGTANYTMTQVVLGETSASNGTLNLNGGTLTANTIAGGGGISKVLNFNGGTLIPSASSGSFVTGVDANVRNGGAAIDSNGFDLTIISDLSHSTIPGDLAIDGGLTKTGSGNLTLNGSANNYTGDTKVLGGSLTIYNAFLADTSNITIGSGATLDLQTGLTDTVKTLVIAGEAQAIGTWGSLASTATHKTAAITSTGILNVTAIATASAYSTYLAMFPSLTGPNVLPGADPDRDGVSNLAEFALKGDPTSGANQGLSRVVIQDVSAPVGKELTLVTAVRRGATFASGPGNSQTATRDGVSYTIQGSLDLVTFTSAVSHISNSNTAAGLPDLTSTDWEYHTFKLNASEGLVGKGFLRDLIQSAP